MNYAQRVLIKQNPHAVVTASIANTSSTFFSLTPTQLLGHVVKAKQSGSDSMVPFKQNEEWNPWQFTVELQCKADRCYCIVDLLFESKMLTTGDDKELWCQQ